MKKYVWMLGMFAIGIGIYAWTIEAHEAVLIKIVCAEIGSFALFCGLMAVLHDCTASRH